MQVTEQRFGNAMLLAVSGRLDRETADLFSASLQPHLDNCKTGGDVLLLDFAGVQYISSLGLQVLLRALRMTKMQGGAFAVAALQGGAKSVFETANFAKVIRCHESVDKALSEMSYSAYTVYKQQGAQGAQGA